MRRPADGDSPEARAAIPTDPVVRTPRLFALGTFRSSESERTQLLPQKPSVLDLAATTGKDEDSG
jgi:hypothetical protein